MPFPRLAGRILANVPVADTSGGAGFSSIGSGTPASRRPSGTLSVASSAARRRHPRVIPPQSF